MADVSYKRSEKVCRLIRGRVSGSGGTTGLSQLCLAGSTVETFFFAGYICVHHHNRLLRCIDLKTEPEPISFKSVSHGGRAAWILLKTDWRKIHGYSAWRLRPCMPDLGTYIKATLINTTESLLNV